MSDETKYCTRCHRRRSVEEFYPGSAASRARYMQPCKDCVRTQRRETRRTERGAAYLRNYRLNYAFGISADDYLQMAEDQDYRCAVCRQPETAMRAGKVKRLAVDHDHDTDKVRGLLCTRCNTAIGLLRDDPALVFGVARYLTEHSAAVEDVA